MPVVRVCPYCKKSFLKSTYQMFEHVQKCDKYKPVIVNVNNNSNEKSLKIMKVADEIKPDILFSYKSQDPK